MYEGRNYNYNKLVQIVFVNEKKNIGNNHQSPYSDTKAGSLWHKTAGVATGKRKIYLYLQ